VEHKQKAIDLIFAVVNRLILISDSKNQTKTPEVSRGKGVILLELGLFKNDVLLWERVQTPPSEEFSGIKFKRQGIKSRNITSFGGSKRV
jgi:hypothetical protein